MDPSAVDAKHADELADDADKSLVVGWPPVSGRQDEDVPGCFAELAKMTECVLAQARAAITVQIQNQTTRARRTRSRNASVHPEAVAGEGVITRLRLRHAVIRETPLCQPARRNGTYRRRCWQTRKPRKN
jgi:hypothetical protein